MIPKYFEGQHYIIWKVYADTFLRQEKGTKKLSVSTDGHKWVIPTIEAVAQADSCEGIDLSILHPIIMRMSKLLSNAVSI